MKRCKLIGYIALVVWPWYIKDLRQFKVYYHDAKKTIWREQQGKGTGSCWTVLCRLSLPLWIYWYTLFIAVKAKRLKTKFKNITEWRALQPTLSNKLVLPLFLSSNSVCDQFACTHHFSTWQSIAVFLLYSLLIQLLLGMNSLLLTIFPVWLHQSLLGLLLRKSNCPEVEVTCNSEWGSFPAFIIINGVSFIDFCKRWIKARPFL